MILPSLRLNRLFASTLCLMLSASVSAETVRINPSALRKRLLEGNNAVLVGLNQVAKAKDQVNLSRAQLLPSVNLGALLGSAANPTFLLSSVTFLLPFLVPSNWLDLKESKQLLQAELISYRLIQLDQYASAYTIYSTMIVDENLAEILQTQHGELKKIETIIQQRYQAGAATLQDLQQAQARAQLAGVRVSQMKTLLLQERAALRQTLGLSLSQTISIEEAHVPSSSQEGSSASSVVSRAIANAPEAAQLSYLKLAAQASRWSKIFGFLTGVTLSSKRVEGSAPGVPASFSPFVQSGTMNFGFSIFPTISLSNREIHGIELRMREMQLEQTRIVESVLGTISEAKTQLSLAKQAEQNLVAAYDAELKKYQTGAADLERVFEMQNDVTVASTERVKALMELDRQRIILHRVMLSDQFTSIVGCRPISDPKLLPKRPTIDQYCSGH